VDTSLLEELPTFRLKERMELRDALPVEAPRLLLLMGPEASGKTLTLKSLLKELEDAGQAVAGFVQCDLFLQEREVLEELVLELREKLEGYDDASQGWHATPSNMVESFETELGRLAKLAAPRRIVLAFDHAEALRKYSDVLGALSNRDSASVSNYSVVLISTHSWEDIRPRCFADAPTERFLFHPYDPDVIQDITARHVQRRFPEFALPTIRPFVSVMFSTLTPLARDLRELQRLAVLFWPCYSLPIKAGELQPSQQSELYVRFRTTFISAAMVHRARIRDLPASELEATLSRLKEKGMTDKETLREQAQDEEELRQARLRECELPFAAKLLLVASFLASWNPPRLDAKYFGKQKTRKMRKNAGPRHASIELSDVKPRTVPVRRLLTIAHCIMPRHLRGSKDILSSPNSMLGTLVSIGLLTRTSSYTNNAKFRTAIDLATADNYGRALNIDLQDYLHHPE
jgi:origin recognition complex subunit 5